MMTGKGKHDRRLERRRLALFVGVVLSFGTLACEGNSKSGSGAADSVAAAAPGNVPGAASAVEGGAEAGRRKIVFAGTSLTAGMGLEPEEAYPSHVAIKIDSAGLPFDVVNAGVSGETTAGLLRRIDWLVRQPFDVIVVETGANDGLRGLDVAAARDNLTRIVQGIRAANPDAAIVLAQMEAPPNLGSRYTAEFRQMYVDVSREHDLVLMPFLLDGVAGVRALNQPDGIHPNPEGARRMAENVWAVLEPILRGRAGE
jgi:acyl-CoA thioesterase I